LLATLIVHAKQEASTVGRDIRLELEDGFEVEHLAKAEPSARATYVPSARVERTRRPASSSGALAVSSPAWSPTAGRVEVD